MRAAQLRVSRVTGIVSLAEKLRICPGRIAAWLLPSGKKAILEVGSFDAKEGTEILVSVP